MEGRARERERKRQGKGNGRGRKRKREGKEGKGKHKEKGNIVGKAFSSLVSLISFHSFLSLHFLGGNGYINEYPTGRIWRDAKLYEIGAGTSEIRRLIIGREFNKMFK